MGSKSNFLVYKHTSPSGKSYIGQTNNYERRCKHHKSNFSRCMAFSNAIKKYGWDNFTHEIIRNNLTIEEANYWERFYILSENSIFPFGYNLKTGGDNASPCKATRDKLSIIASNMTKEQRAKIAESVRGLKHSDETKLKISIGNKGKIVSKETREKLSIANKGRIASKETREKLSMALKGKKHTEERRANKSARQKGRVHSKETKEKISASAKGRVHTQEAIEKRKATMLKKKLERELSSGMES